MHNLSTENAIKNVTKALESPMIGLSKALNMKATDLAILEAI